MSRWKTIVGLLCLAIWLPATQHCQLEKLPGLSFLQCAGDSDGRDCQGDSCDVVERGVYKTSDTGDVAAIFVSVLLENIPSLAVEPAGSVNAGLSVSECVPLPDTWQTYSVLAVPIRGPSFPS